MGTLDPEGMISSGVLGPLGAAETFVPGQFGKRARLESNAIFKIRWSVLDELRGQDPWVLRRVLRSTAASRNSTLTPTSPPWRCD